MGLFSAIKYLVILIIVMVVVGSLYMVMNLKAELAISEENNKKLETAVEQQQEVLRQKERDIEAIQEINNKLIDTNENLQKDIDNLNNKFEVNAKGQSRDFGDITRAKPGLINKIIDKATVNVNRCLEIASGSPIKEGERNNECQELIDSLTK